MSDGSLASIECLSTNLYTYRITVASREAVEGLLAIMERFIEQRTAREPLYLLLDGSSLDIAYTPRVRERLEYIISEIHHHHEMIRIAFVVPNTMGNCAVFLNNMMRSRQTSQIRHTCFANRQDALRWLQDLQRRESLPAAQGF